MLSSFVDYPPARLVSVSPVLMYVGESCCLTTATENTARWAVSVTALTSDGIIAVSPAPAPAGSD